LTTAYKVGPRYKVDDEASKSEYHYTHGEHEQQTSTHREVDLTQYTAHIHGRLQECYKGEGGQYRDHSSNVFLLRVDNRPTVVEKLVASLLNFSVDSKSDLTW